MCGAHLPLQHCVMNLPTARGLQILLEYFKKEKKAFFLI